MILFLISLIICIILHELGHLIAAKLCGCGVTVFSVGFGKPIIYKIKLGSTVYQLTPWIIGGFCALKDELISSTDKDAFTNQRYSKKLIILIAGCLINILTGLIALIFGNIYYIYPLFYFGSLSIILGITNLIPIPCLDGSYAILVWLEKFYGKEKGYKLMEKICRIGFKIVMALNIASIPYIAYLYIYKGFRLIL